MTEAYLTGLVPRLQPGVTEIYCHPGLYADPELTRWAPQYRRQEELAALLSPHVKATLAAAGVRRTDFRELCLRHSRPPSTMPRSWSSHSRRSYLGCRKHGLP